MVFWILFWTGILSLHMAEPWLDSLEGWTNSPVKTPQQGKAPGPVPSHVLPKWVEEEIDHLLEQQLGKSGNYAEGRRCDDLCSECVYE